jgi:cytochrome c peroxidase
MRLAEALLAIAVVLAPTALAHDEPPPPLKAGEVLFEPPAPGTYELPAIRHVSERELLDADGKPAPLLGLARGRVAVVSFIYRSCTDARGCPAALATLRRLDRELAARPELAARTRLVTVSFDPQRDTPDRMAELRRHMEPRGDWRFLTTPSVQAIEPILKDFDQDVLRVVTNEGEESPLFAHLLKVFLVDAGGSVCNIYGAGFLDWRILLNDVQTLTDPER